jgi:hypothetical protein
MDSNYLFANFHCTRAARLASVALFIGGLWLEFADGKLNSHRSGSRIVCVRIEVDGLAP